MNNPLSALLLASTILLSACGAKFRAFPDEGEPSPKAVEAGHSSAWAFRAHGHRDFPREFESVWAATVEALHSRGIAVPRSAQPSQHLGTIDLDALSVHVEERYAGRVCVLLRFRALEEGDGEVAARDLLNEIQGRL
jgi:hypothetical protein